MLRELETTEASTLPQCKTAGSVIFLNSCTRKVLREMGKWRRRYARISNKNSVRAFSWSEKHQQAQLFSDAVEAMLLARGDKDDVAGRDGEILLLT